MKIFQSGARKSLKRRQKIIKATQVNHNSDSSKSLERRQKIGVWKLSNFDGSVGAARKESIVLVDVNLRDALNEKKVAMKTDIKKNHYFILTLTSLIGQAKIGKGLITSLYKQKNRETIT